VQKLRILIEDSDQNCKFYILKFRIMLQTINYKFREQIQMEEENFSLHFISNVVKQLNSIEQLLRSY
jgi:hypothetical protein